ncbi:putative amidoligase domain-containing protein [Paenibacillus wynnii]|uniref:putative amidoligase domain-containing protein n=1 Tax=Paenibacillus wynnii TaxID=268407 RepID=UPI0027D79523|nr:hypothetical protein [Paenibacillus wynnii]
MNEGHRVFDTLSLEQREQRLLRSGVEAALTQQSKLMLRNIRVMNDRVMNDGEMNNSARNGMEGDIGLSGSVPPNDTHRKVRHRLRYKVYIYNLGVLKILPFRAGEGMKGLSLTHGSGDSVEPPERRGLNKLLEGIAVRALYSVGLDSGEVLLLCKGDRRYVVEEIAPLKEQSGEPLPEPYRTAELALDRILAQELPGRPGMMMGMDPEFLLQRGAAGRVVPASLYLPTDGVAGCDAGPPGTRGTFPVAELRPRPRGSPRALLAQLMSAAATADRLIADRSLAWRAGGMPLRGWALGGHLHFSGVSLTAPLLRALDNYLALPMMLLEDSRAAARRPRYGVLGDFRHQPHGGFEYRTLPSFLVSPVVAKGAVYLAHLIVSRYEDLPLRPLDREDLHAAYYRGDKPPLREAFAPLRGQLRALGGYELAARYIEPLFRYIDVGKTWNEARDIRGLWCAKEAP